MADFTITLDELAVALLMAGMEGDVTPDRLIECVESLRQVRRTVASVAETKGHDLDSVLHPAEGFAILAEASTYIAAGQEATR